MTLCHQPGDWLKAFGPYFTGVVALLIALFGEYMRRLTFRPKLNVSASNNSPHCVMNKYYGTVERPHYSLRIAIENSGRAEAKEVEVFAKDLKRQEGEGKFETVTDFHETYLRWSGQDDQALGVLNPKMPKYCYLARVFWKDEHLPTSFCPQIPPPKEDYLGDVTRIAFSAPIGSERPQFRGPGRYRLTVRIGAANARPVEKVLKINVTGKWPRVEPQNVGEVLEFGMESS